MNTNRFNPYYSPLPTQNCESVGRQCQQVGGTCYFMAVMNFIAHAEPILRMYMESEIFKSEPRCQYMLERLPLVIDFALEVTACRNSNVVDAKCKNLPPVLAEIYREYGKIYNVIHDDAPVDFSVPGIKEKGSSVNLLICIFLQYEYEYMMYIDALGKRYKDLFLDTTKTLTEHVSDLVASLPGLTQPEVDTLIDSMSNMKPSYGLQGWLYYHHFKYTDGVGVGELSIGESKDSSFAKFFRDFTNEYNILEQYTFSGSLDMTTSLIPFRVYNILIHDQTEISRSLINIDTIIRSVLINNYVSLDNCLILGGTVGIGTKNEGHEVSWNFCDTQPDSLESIQEAPIIICDSALQICFRSDTKNIPVGTGDIGVQSWGLGKSYDTINKETTLLGAIYGLSSTYFTGGIGDIDSFYLNALVTSVTIVIAKKLD